MKSRHEAGHAPTSPESSGRVVGGRISELGRAVGGVRVPLDSVAGSDRGRIREAVQALRTSGGTNGQGGIQAIVSIFFYIDYAKPLDHLLNGQRHAVQRYHG